MINKIHPNPSIETENLINDINDFISPDYCKDMQNPHSSRDYLSNSVSYIASNVNLLFFKIFHFFVRLVTWDHRPLWENDSTLWNRLQSHLNGLILSGDFYLNDDEVKNLELVYNRLRHRVRNSDKYIPLARLFSDREDKSLNIKLSMQVVETSNKLKDAQLKFEKLSNINENLKSQLSKNTIEVLQIKNDITSENNKIQCLLSELDNSSSKKIEQNTSITTNSTLQSQSTGLCFEMGWSMATYINKLDPSLNDKDEIIFNNSTLVKAVNSDSSSTENSCSVFHKILQENYGKDLTDLVWKRYQFDELESITLGDLKMALIGASANVRLADIKSLFDAIKRYDKGMISHRCGDYLHAINSTMFFNIKKKKAFTDLNNEEIYFLISAFTTLPANNLPKNSLDVLYNDMQIDHIVYQQNSPNPLLQDDLLNLKNLSLWSKTDIQQEMGKELSQEDHYRALISEYVGKILAYGELNEGMLVVLPSINNTPICYKVESKFDKKGIFAFLLTPIIPPADNNSQEIFLTFRGTHTFQQMIRDIDFDGIGKKEFDELGPEILKMVEKFSKKVDNPIIIHATGHSLGGCDSARFLPPFIKKWSEDTESPLRKINSIRITTHNSPKTEPNLNDSVCELIASMNKSENEKIKIEIVHVQIEEDPIQEWGGEFLIGTGNDTNSLSIFEEAKDIVNVKLIKVKAETPQNPSYFWQHAFCPFSLRGNTNCSTTLIDDSDRDLLDLHLSCNNENSKMNNENQAFYWKIMNNMKSLSFNSLHFVLHKTMSTIFSN